MTDIERVGNVAKEARNVWFKGCKIKDNTKNDYMQNVVFGKKGTKGNNLILTLSRDSLVFTGDYGTAIFRFPYTPTDIRDLGRSMLLSEFTQSLNVSEEEMYFFYKDEAVSSIDQLMSEWCEVDSVDELEFEDKLLRDQLVYAAQNCYSVKAFTADVLRIYQASSVEWFTSKETVDLSKCGMCLENRFIGYWVALKMISEELNGLRI